MQKQLIAKRSGKSKEKRSDCPQVAVGLVVDENGFAIKHKLFAGNTADSDTLLGIVHDLKKNIGTNSPTIIVDSGMSKDEHLEAIRKAGFHYVVTQKRSKRVNYPEIFGNDTLFATIPGREKHSPVQVYKKEEKDHVLLFCKSEGRKHKETAIKEYAHLKLIESLSKLAKRITAGKLKDPSKIQEAIGRLKERHHRVSRFYEIKLTNEATQLSLSWQHKTDTNENLFDGCYIIKTSRKDLSDQDIWSVYMTLVQVERSFRDLKSELGLRPNFHWREDRVDSHIFITILAYHLLHAIEYRLQQADDYRQWPTIRQLLETHCYTTMILPTTKGAVLNIRKAGLPDAEQKELYSKLQVSYHGLPIKKVIA